ncbi:hypothetical protein KZ483_15100 [Paenibacillus sp. sptzw28]|uniref:hypothetical protein n=1 Tax=Paenibacillus sp. sptzw28 TaxID=715179 RepID=UPI001C6E8F5F|nr:hypothetical protein [Paenibacillus sp. sptzw28]QYR19272.1 hypothetical protein KZ483_15100 [Paenibacillus sp. sptzw28]
MQPKNPMTALLLSFIPGLGHLYLNRFVRAVMYGCGFFGPVALIFLLLVSGGHDEEFIVLLLIIAFLIGVVNLIDMVIYLVRGRVPSSAANVSSVDELTPVPPRADNDRFPTILLSIIPGLGHFHLGLMQRGLSFLIAFFGLLAMVFFIAVTTARSEFLAFLFVLPIIWLYAMSDCVQQLNRKQRGDALMDRTFFEDFQESRSDGKKSKMIAMFLSIVPGAGHMYLGLQKRGLQLMAAFLFSIYIMDVLRLSIFLFVIPILWFYSFFDALQQISKQGREELKDVPFVEWLVHNQKWVGIVLLVLGLYHVTDEMLLRVLDRMIPKINVSSLFHQYFQTFVVSVILIGGGLRLLFGSKKRKGEGR